MAAFWDSSAIVDLCVPGRGSSFARRLQREHSTVIWWATPVEVHGAIERMRRESTISPFGYEVARDRLAQLLGTWREVDPTETVRDYARNQLRKYPLRAADALQLAAALDWCKAKTRGRLFVSNDRALSAAASQAGFDVLSM